MHATTPAVHVRRQSKPNLSDRAAAKRLQLVPKKLSQIPAIPPAPTVERLLSFDAWLDYGKELKAHESRIADHVKTFQLVVGDWYNYGVDHWKRPAERAARLGYLAQDAYLFSGSVGDNIAFDRPEVDLAKGIAVAALLSDIQEFPQGIDTQIGEQGMRVSGGQRQRIALARALGISPHARPGLLLLDDPFSAVDLQTEHQIIKSMRVTYGRKAVPEERATIVLASHRLLTFPLADRVIVLNNGVVAEMGTHAQLLAAGGLYAHIFKAQSRVSKPAGAAV